MFENENNYGMTSCPSGKIAEVKGRYGSFILLGHVEEVIYMLIYDEVLKIERNFCFQAVLIDALPGMTTNWCVLFCYLSLSYLTSYTLGK